MSQCDTAAVGGGDEALADPHQGSVDVRTQLFDQVDQGGNGGRDDDERGAVDRST